MTYPRRRWRLYAPRVAAKNNRLFLSVSLNVLLAGVILYIWQDHEVVLRVGSLRSSPKKWHGGHPSMARSGSCWCGQTDGYCMCTPNLAMDLVLLSGRDHIWLVTRKDTSQLATVGGFVNMGESVEDAVLRELSEETGITSLPSAPILVGVYSDPRRDNRRHTVSVVYAVHLDGKENPVAADDVKSMVKISIADIEKHDYFADHKTILLDYRRKLHNEHGGLMNTNFHDSPGDFADNIKRSICIG